MTKTMTVNNHAVRWLWLIMALALIIRLIFVLIIDPSPSFAGGDTDYLLQNGLTLINGTASVSPATGPVYLIFAGIVQIIVGVTHAPLTIRVLNSIMGAALCGFIFVLGKRYLNERAGLSAALLIAVSPMFVIEAGNVLTESVFLFLLFGGLALYAVLEDSTPSADHAAQRTRVGILAGVGVLLGLASLTRAVALLLPAVLVIHLIYRYRQVGRKSLRVVGGLVVTLLIAYVLTLSTWTIYNLIRWQHFVIGAEGLAANVYIGTTNWCGPQCIDQSAGITGQTDNQSAYVQGAAATISADPIGYLRHRAENLIGALLQPYNTVYYPGASIKTIVADWWGHGHMLSGLGRVFASDAFWPKLALYIFHYGALIFGVIGILIGLRRALPNFPLYGTAAYFLAIHTVLTAIPRYVFVIEPLWYVFAAYALISIADVLFHERRPAQLSGVERAL